MSSRRFALPRSQPSHSSQPRSPPHRVLASLHKRSHYDDDSDDTLTESSSSDSGDSSGSSRSRGRRRRRRAVVYSDSGGSSGSKVVIFALFILLAAALAAAFYFYQKQGSRPAASATAPIVSKPATTTDDDLLPSSRSSFTPLSTPTRSTLISSRETPSATDSDVLTRTGSGGSNPSKTDTSKPTPSSGGDSSGGGGGDDDDDEDGGTGSPSSGKDTTKPSATATSDPKPTGSTSSDATSSVVSKELLDGLLSAHNDFRAKHQVDPLEWNDTLAEASNRWVENCVFEHSGGKLLAGGYGENLFATSGTGSTESSPVDVEGGVNSWNSEDKLYTYNPPTGFTHETGHFTQVVWKGTKSVGCQFKNCQGIFTAGQWGSYLVCQYYPPGNWEGQFLENVLPEA